MKRIMVTAVIPLLVFAAAAMACPMGTGTASGHAQGTPLFPRVGFDCPLFHSTGNVKAATWDGNIYVLKGNTLVELNSDLQQVESVQLASLPTPAKASGTSSTSGQTAAQSGCQCACGANMMGPGGGARGMMGHMGRPAGMAAGNPRNVMPCVYAAWRTQQLGGAELTANADGVYVIRGGTLTVYDHNLSQAKTERVAQVPPRSLWQQWAGVADAQGYYGQGYYGMMGNGRMGYGMMGNGRMMGWGARHWQRGHESVSRPEWQALDQGTVAIQYSPAPLQRGRTEVSVLVDRLSGHPDGQAHIRAFLYPTASPSRGKTIDLSETHPGYFEGSAAIKHDGPQELAIRVQRPHLEDQIAYFDLSVSG